MKPKFIFTAVFAVCLIMGGLLPRLAYGKHTTAAAVISPTQVSAQAAQPVTKAGARVASAVEQAQAAVKAKPTARPTPLPTIAPFAQPELAAQAPAQQKAAQPAGVPLTANLPDLNAFVASVNNGQSQMVTGVYIQGVLALPVVQQPAGDDVFVSTDNNTVTQYERPADFGVIGLLAHNTLSGQEFFKIKANQQVVLVYGDGHQARYKVTSLQRYQALNPTDAYSDFVDLNGPGGQVLNYQALFQRMYTQSSQVVFQTCFEANGDLSWGRLFIIATPA